MNEVLSPGRTVMRYTDDFGDDWEHKLIVSDVRNGEPGVVHPRYVAGENNTPPEDCGGLPGFYYKLENVGDLITVMGDVQGGNSVGGRNFLNIVTFGLYHS